jgi:hypothetical protein
VKIKVVEGRTPEGFEYNMEFYINKFISDGNEIIDIKFGGATEQSFSYGTSYVYSAMIIYR